MLTVITGIPGSGKTLYTVDKLLQPLLTSKVKHTDADGVVSEVPRRILSNINGLLIAHEKIGPGAAMNHNGKTDKWEQGEGDRLGLNNWHEWAKPGDVIVFDEVQKPWPLAATGSKVPPYIEALETHRHMGVDFILMTQHPMMIHANIVRLCGRHLHMRRLGNMKFATAYEWDGCSRTLLYKSCMAKFPYRYNKKVFELYKSAEMHTKQPRKLPSLIFGVLFAVGLLGYFGPVVTSRLKDRLNPQEVAKVPAKDVKTVTVTHDLPFGVLPPAPGEVPRPPASAPVAAEPRQTVVAAGCASSKDRCTCYEETGKIVQADEAMCRQGSAVAGFVVIAKAGEAR